MCPGEDLNITCSVQVVALFSKELATFSSPHETVPRTVSSLGKRKSALLRDALFLKCPGEDLNLHTLRHIHLKDTCIPISPPGHYLFSKWRHYGLLARIFQLLFGSQSFGLPIKSLISSWISGCDAKMIFPCLSHKSLIEASQTLQVPCSKRLIFPPAARTK